MELDRECLINHRTAMNLSISPFVFGFGETHFATNNMIFGAIVVILGVGSIFYELYHKERETLVAMEHAKERV